LLVGFSIGVAREQLCALAYKRVLQMCLGSI
jgi:hypothetical protein